MSPANRRRSLYEGITSFFVTTISFVIPLCLKRAKAWIWNIDNPPLYLSKPAGTVPRQVVPCISLSIIYLGGGPEAGRLGATGC